MCKDDESFTVNGKAQRFIADTEDCVLDEGNSTIVRTSKGFIDVFAVQV
jgi:hypothetical protein